MQPSKLPIRSETGDMSRCMGEGMKTESYLFIHMTYALTNPRLTGSGNLSKGRNRRLKWMTLEMEWCWSVSESHPWTIPLLTKSCDLRKRKKWDRIVKGPNYDCRRHFTLTCNWMSLSLFRGDRPVNYQCIRIVYHSKRYPEVPINWKNEY
jgi:hypothetical protein